MTLSYEVRIHSLLAIRRFDVRMSGYPMQVALKPLEN